MILKMIRFDGEELLAPRPTTKLEDHTLSVVRDSLFNIFAATVHIGGRFSIRNLRTSHAVVRETRLSWTQGQISLVNLPMKITNVADNVKEFKIALKQFLCPYSFYTLDECFNQSRIFYCITKIANYIGISLRFCLMVNCKSIH